MKNVFLPATSSVAVSLFLRPVADPSKYIQHLHRVSLPMNYGLVFLGHVLMRV